jgi:hypothetical protein
MDTNLGTHFQRVSSHELRTKRFPETTPSGIANSTLPNLLREGRVAAY